MMVMMIKTSFSSCFCSQLLSCSFLAPLGRPSILHPCFVCLPVLFAPSTCPYSATAGGLLTSILVTCPNHASLLFLILSTSTISCPSSALVQEILLRDIFGHIHVNE